MSWITEFQIPEDNCCGLKDHRDSKTGDKNGTD